MIALLNSSYVPVYVSNEDYRKGGTAPEDAQQIYLRIYHEALREKRPAGSVCVYLVGPDGKGLASQIVSDAAKGDQLRQLLAATAEKLQTPAGRPLVPPAAQSVAPPCPPGGLVLHLVARIDHRGSWGEFPSENWIVLRPEDCRHLLPPAAAPGTAWEIDPAVAARVLTHFYPQTETCNFAQDAVEGGPHRHHLDTVALKATVLPAEQGRTRVRLDGRVKLKHSFYPGRDDDLHAEATVVGYLDVDPARQQVLTLRLVTAQATYGKRQFTVTVTSPETPAPR